MGLVEGVLCEVRHVIVNLVCRLLVDPVGDTALYALFLISVNKVLALLRHDRRLFLRHGTAHKVASAEGISGEISDDLHDLLLVDDTAVGRL